MWRSTLKVLRDIALLLARLGTAVVLGMHGWQRWTGGIDKTSAWLAANGIPTPGALAWLLTILELAGAVMLFFGALTPVIGLVMVLMSAFIAAWITWKNGFWAVNGGYETQILVAALGLIFLVFGAGRAAVDNLLKRDDAPNDDLPTVEEFPGTPRRSGAGASKA